MIMVTREEAIESPIKNLGKDIEMKNNDIIIDSNNDFSVISYQNNLAQALRNRLQTTLSEMILHQDYGSKLKLLIGSQQSETLKLEMRSDIEFTMLQEPRVKETLNIQVEFDEQIKGRVVISLEVQPIDGIEPLNMIYELFI